MRKLFGLLCVVAALTALTGCKESEPEATTTPAVTDEASTDTAAMPADEAPAEEAQ